MMDGIDMGKGVGHAEVRMSRRFSPAYKKRILEELDAAAKGEKGAILRRESLYSSTVSRWRQQREAGALDGLREGKRGPKGKNPAVREAERLRTENARLAERLSTLEDLVEAQGKVSALLQELSRESDDTE
jgi:transposase-like protein